MMMRESHHRGLCLTRVQQTPSKVMPSRVLEVEEGLSGWQPGLCRGIQDCAADT